MASKCVSDGKRSTSISLEYHSTLHDSSRTWREYLFDSQFYLVAVIWMLTRVISNVSQVYLPLYIMDTTDASQVDRVRSKAKSDREDDLSISDLDCYGTVVCLYQWISHFVPDANHQSLSRTKTDDERRIDCRTHVLGSLLECFHTERNHRCADAVDDSSRRDSTRHRYHHRADHIQRLHIGFDWTEYGRESLGRAKAEIGISVSS